MNATPATGRSVGSLETRTCLGILAGDAQQGLVFRLMDKGDAAND